MNVINLDNWALFREIDPDDMLGHIAELPQHRQCFGHTFRS